MSPTPPAAPDEISRLRFSVTGTVQGVGFRPFVYRLALEEGLVGAVLNEGRGVFVEVQGTAAQLDRFAARLKQELPRPGRVEGLSSEPLPVDAALDRFSIAPSSDSGSRRMSLAPDVAVCSACLAELADPDDRRYRYPFINCTHCGPRYTITKALPYDRPQTTMATFEMCAECRAEYTDPLDRRYHAQPVACPACGPVTWLAAADDQQPLVPRRDPRDPAAALERACACLASGQIVAIKGLGGFHLAASARDDDAVARLRAGKQRPRKPLAVMVRDLDVAQAIAELDGDALELLTSAEAPIVLAPRRADAGLSQHLAPGLDDVGLMLPYTPLHRLLFSDDLDVLVMTSGNHPSEPITTDNAEALRLLEADAFLLHDRDIHVACDDSVVRSAPSGAIPVRRARGFVPGALDAGLLPARAVVGLGAELKATVATLCNGELVVGRHLGDLDNPRAEAAYREELERMLRFGKVEPEAVACDLHPDLFSTLFAQERFAGLPLLRVQHHHAHLCALLAEHGAAPDVEVAAVVLDGLGYGLDGTIWGGEVLVGGYADFRRAAHLRQVPQPGGDRAAKEPRRMATSLLLDAGRGDEARPGFDASCAQIWGVRAVSPLTSSAGRLFDGVAALLGVAPPVQDYEGEAAMRLEAAAAPDEVGSYPLDLAGAELDTRELICALLDDRAGVPVRAARFHNGLADGLARAALGTGRDTVALSGGCLVNRLLGDRLEQQLRRAGVRVLRHRRLPPGDGGVSAGQAVCAACRMG